MAIPAKQFVRADQGTDGFGSVVGAGKFDEAVRHRSPVASGADFGQ